MDRLPELVNPALVRAMVAVGVGLVVIPENAGVILYAVAYVAEGAPTATAATVPPQVGVEMPSPSTDPRLKLTSLADPITTLPPNPQAAPPPTVVAPWANPKLTAFCTVSFRVSSTRFTLTNL